ncbi:MAG: Peptidase T [Promethearchaeota archaeon]|nr:MAG: Peptidase T [Candidatus Lokiarchaeota archaeon]
MISEKIQEFLQKDALNRFLKYVKIWSTSDDEAESFPSTEIQIEFGKVLVEELKELGLTNIVHDDYGYVYATLPPSEGCEEVQNIALIAHLDTSYSVSGRDVKPVIHENYDGGVIKFASNEELELSPDDSPQLREYVGLDIITSQGDTLLGADDKAGIAEIMAACAAMQKFPELNHGPITVCFFPDEELGKGTDHINLDMLPELGYTLDGDEMGQLEYECFDAWKASFTFHGYNVHPGYAKDLMINAVEIATRFLSELPEAETPEHTEERDGFFHLFKLNGNPEKASGVMIIRDFELEKNKRRMEYLKELKEAYETRYPGLKIEMDFEHQYENMYNYLENEQKLIDLAKKAITKAGLEFKTKPIRGGTDGARLSAMGVPTPNIFTGGMLFHSKKEYIPVIALKKASEVVLNLIKLWTQEK